MSKVTLADVGTLTDVTTAQTVINTNSSAIVAGFDNTLSLDGAQPNTMGANLDMNSNRILNLPTPGSSFEPARLADIEALTGGGTITVNPLPTGGTTHQVLTKQSNGNFDANWNTVTTLFSVVNTIDGNTGTFTTGNGIDSSGQVIELTAARRTFPTHTKILSGSGTYTTPANCLYIRGRMVGGGGGGSGSGLTGSTGIAGGSGGNTTFNAGAITALGGAGGNGDSPGAGGSLGTGGTISLAGASGGWGDKQSSNGAAGAGGNSVFGGGAGVSSNDSGNAMAAVTNTGGGGAGGGSNANTGVQVGGGGGAGSYTEFQINNPSATYSYVVGVAGTLGNNGSSGVAGGAGGSGIILIDEYYGT